MQDKSLHACLWRAFYLYFDPMLTVRKMNRIASLSQLAWWTTFKRRRYGVCPREQTRLTSPVEMTELLLDKYSCRLIYWDFIWAAFRRTLRVFRLREESDPSQFISGALERVVKEQRKHISSFPGVIGLGELWVSTVVHYFTLQIETGQRAGLNEYWQNNEQWLALATHTPGDIPLASRRTRTALLHANAGVFLACSEQWRLSWDSGSAAWRRSRAD